MSTRRLFPKRNCERCSRRDIPSMGASRDCKPGAAASVNIVRITYSGSLLGITGVMTGQVQMQIAPMTAIPFVKAGRLKALAITSAKPSALFTGLPTVVSSVPGFEYTSTSGMFGPPATPAPVIKRLNKADCQSGEPVDALEKEACGNHTSSTTDCSSSSTYAGRICQQQKGYD